MLNEDLNLSERSLKNLDEHPGGEGIVEVNIRTIWGRMAARALAYALLAFGNKMHSDLIIQKLGLRERDWFSA